MTVTSGARLTNPSGAPVIVLDTSVRKKIQLTFTKTLTPDKRKGGGGVIRNEHPLYVEYVRYIIAKN